MAMERQRARLAGVLLPSAAAGATALAGVLAAHAVSTARTPVLTVDAVVGSTVVALGAVAAAWLAASCALAALCVAVRTVGLTWRAGERAVQRFAPAAVRRVLAVAVATTLAATVATGAGAIETPVGHQAGQLPAADLGWAPSAGADQTDGTASAAPVEAADHARDDLGWVPSGTDATLGSPSSTVPAHRPSAAGPPTVTHGGTTVRTPGSSTEESAAPGSLRGDAKGGTPTSAAPAVSASASAAASAAASAEVSSSPVTTPHRTSRPPSPRASSPAVVVRPGDTLWSIAADHLGAGATTRDVAQAWPAWFHANARVIGSDPDHILPGQHLTVPRGASSTEAAPTSRTTTAGTRTAPTSTEGTHR